MRKLYSTKLPKPIPPEFEANFLAGGWARVNQMYGKRPALRYFTALGAQRLSLARLLKVRKADRASNINGYQDGTRR